MFPFPVCIDPRLPANHPQAPLRDRLRALGERLDAFRKERLAAHDFLTMTGLYNVLERLRELEIGASVEPLSAVEKDIHEAGLVSVLKEIHDEIDRAVFEAYGFDDLGRELVGRPGATTPSMHKSAAQEAAEEELLTRLVALNLERHAEEKRGLVRWLRPDFQIPKLGHKVASPQGEQLFADLDVIAGTDKPKWPSDGLEQIRIVRELLVKASSPSLPDAVAASFEGRMTPARRSRVKDVLETLVATGAARVGDMDGRPRYFTPR
jgi:hypothetical protein